MSTVAFVLLPGLDGTGLLMRGFIEALGVDAEVQVVSYPPDRILGYAELVEFVRGVLPLDRAYLLVAESFSGPVGCALAASRPNGLVGLVLCASFASSPVPSLRRLSFLLPFAPVRAVPIALLAAVLLGRWSSPVLIEDLDAALRSVSPAVLRGRAQAAVTAIATDSLGQIEVPVLYLRATEDHLISEAALQRLRNVIPSITVTTIDGPHFLLQAAPTACAGAIQSFVEVVARRF